MISERDPLGKSAKEPGSKLDEGKAPLLRGCINYFPLALSAVANVSLVGAEKYSWKGWETVPDGINRYGDACARHLAAEGYEEYDKDTGSLHCAQVAWNALAKLELVLRQKRETRQTTEKVHPLAVSGPDGYSEPGGVVEVCFCGEPSYYSTGLCKNCSELNTSFDG